MRHLLGWTSLILLAACGSTAHTPTATAPVIPGTIVGAITSTQGGALSGVRVVVTPGGGTPLGAVTTSSTGNFAATGVPVATDDGTVTLSSLPANCATPSPTAYAGLTGGDTVIVNVTVTCTTPAGPPGSVTGTVTSSSGAGLTGVMVVVTPNGATALSSVATNATGAYTVTNVPAGAGTVSVSGLPSFCTTPASEPYTGLTNTMSVTTDIVVQCVAPTGTVTGTVMSSLGGGLPGIGVVVTPTGGAALPAVTTPASGAYAVHGVPVSNGTGTVSLTGVPASCAAPLATPYTSLANNGTAIANIVVTCAQPGTLTVTVSPSTSMGPVMVSGPNGYTQTLTSTTTLTGLAPGQYSVTAPNVESPDAIVPTLYTATVTGSPASVSAGGSASVSVSYAPVGGTGGLWVMTVNQSFIGELTPTQLRLGGTQTLTPSGTTSAGTAFLGAAFDAQGSLWVTDQLLGQVRGFTAAQLAAGNLSSPAVTITLGGRQPFESGLAFDANGNMWVSDLINLIELTPQQLATGGMIPNPTVIVSGTIEPTAPIAFDASGTLWIGCSIGGVTGPSGICGYTPAQLAAGGGRIDPQDTVLTGSNEVIEGLAFDASGTLWVTASVPPAAPGLPTLGVLAAYTAAQLGAGGTPSPTHSLQFSAAPAGLAFDVSGDAWVCFENSIIEITPAQLAAGTGQLAPLTNVVTFSANTPTTLAFDPHAAGVPISANRVRGLVPLRSAVRRTR